MRGAAALGAAVQGAAVQGAGGQSTIDATAGKCTFATTYSGYGKWSAAKHRRWVHPGLFAAPSTVAKAGTGVFASRALRAGTHLGYYSGRIYWSYPAQNARDWRYFLALRCRPPWVPRDTWATRRKRNEPPCIDGAGMLSLINCCRGGPGENCEFAASGRVHVTRDIAEGGELFVNYGPEYWES